MRSNARLGVTTAAVTAAVLGITGVAVADGSGGYPSQHQVDAARQQVAARQADVAAIRKKLSQVGAQADAAAQRAEIASEAYNGAMWHLSLATKAATKAAADAKAAKVKVANQRVGIAKLVVQSYQNGDSLQSLGAYLGHDGTTGMMQQLTSISMAGSAMQATYDAYIASSKAADTASANAAKAETAQRALAQQAAAARTQAAASAKEADQLLAGVSARRTTLIAALAKATHTSVSLETARANALARIAAAKAAAAARRRAQEAAAAAAAAQQAAANHGGGGGGNQPAPPPPVTHNGGAAAALAFARAQIGKPYLWAGAGPYSFDCSGLTMRAWEQGGIDMPHFAASQYNYGTPEPISDAQPGDLLFWSYNGAPSGIHHVAIYVGGGTFIEAPHTGAFVRYNSIYNWYPNFAVRMP